MLDILRIAICDDDNEFLEELYGILNSYANEHHIDMGVYKFEDGFFLLEELRRREKSKTDLFDIVILDYKMKSLMNGLETAKMIRMHGYPCDIVFLTEHKKFIFDAFEVATSRFLMKPIDKDKLYEYLHSYIRTQKKSKPILLEDNGVIVKVKSSDIMYLKADGTRCYIYLKDKTIRYWKTLNKVLELMPKPYFYRVHRSFAVNMDYIKSTEGNTVTMEDGCSISISKVNISKFKKDFKDFVKNFKNKNEPDISSLLQVH